MRTNEYHRGSSYQFQTGSINNQPTVFFVPAFYLCILLPYQHYFFLIQGSDRYELTLGFYLSMMAVISTFFSLFASIIIYKYRINFNINGPLSVLFILFLVAAIWGQFGLFPVYSTLYALAALALLIALQPMFLSLKGRGFKDLDRAAWLLLILMLILLIYHEIEFPRRVGGIQPNQWAKLSILAMALSFLAGSKKKFIFVIFAILLTAFAASRGGLILIVCFLSVYILLSRPVISAILIFLSSSFIIAILAITVSYFLPSLFDLIYSDVFAIDDEHRAIIGTGFTGRVDFWIVAINLFGEGNFWNMLFGLGFATRAGVDVQNIQFISAHQGFLNILLDLGFVGLTLFLVSVLWAILRGIRMCRLCFDVKFNASLVAFLFSYLVSMLIDPLYIRVGTPFSFLLFFLLVASSQHKLSGKPQ